MPDTGTPGETSVVAWYRAKTVEQRQRSSANHLAKWLRYRDVPRWSHVETRQSWRLQLRQEKKQRGQAVAQTMRHVSGSLMTSDVRAQLRLHPAARLPDESADDVRKARNARKRERRGRCR